MVIIPKPNKKSYNSPKLFRPIILFNTVDKLIEKVIGKRLQFNTVINDFIYLSQLKGFKFKLTTNIGVILTHTIWASWIKNLYTSTLTFDIAQFFSLLNHQLLFFIMKKASFDHCIVSFFANYLVNRRTNYS